MTCMKNALKVTTRTTMDQLAVKLDQWLYAVTKTGETKRYCTNRIPTCVVQATDTKELRRHHRNQQT